MECGTGEGCAHTNYSLIKRSATPRLPSLRIQLRTSFVFRTDGLLTTASMYRHSTEQIQDDLVFTVSLVEIDGAGHLGTIPHGRTWTFSWTSQVGRRGTRHRWYPILRDFAGPSRSAHR